MIILKEKDIQMNEDFPKPIVIISKCLGFEKCRYDGSIINDHFVKSLQNYVDFVTVCPEKEIGLGVPRDPVRLVQEEGQKRLFQPATGRDASGEMNKYIDDFLENLQAADGFILKHRSPSCGLSSVKIYYGFEEKVNHFRGRGMFGEAIVDNFGMYPVEDEGRLRNFSIRENFLIKLFTVARFREIKENPQANKLVDFHTNNKFLFMAHNQNKMRELGRITANSERIKPKDLFYRYEEKMLDLLKTVPKFTAWINVLQHAFGYISDGLSSDEKEFFMNAVEEYRDERIPLSVLIKLIKSWALRFENDYLLRQSFLNPYPTELVEITDSGKGRTS